VVVVASGSGNNSLAARVSPMIDRRELVAGALGLAGGMAISARIAAAGLVLTG